MRKNLIMILGKSMVCLQGGLEPAGWLRTSTKALPNHQWETNLMLVTQVVLGITWGTYKSKADSRLFELDPWESLISRSSTGQVRLVMSRTYKPQYHLLSSDVGGSVHFCLTTDPPVGSWASSLTSFFFNFF